MRYINVTIELLRTFSSSKRMKELLAVAVWMKMQHSNGVMWGVSAYRLKKELHIGKDKARRLVSDMRDCSLFAVDGDKVRVATFRDRTAKRTRQGRVYRGAMVCRFAVADYTLKELYNIINDKLFEFVVCAAVHKDCSVKGHESAISAKGAAVTMRRFGKAVGMSIGSVAAIKRRTVGAGRICSTMAEKYSFDVRNEDEMRTVLRRTGKREADWMKGNLGFVVLPCFYAVVDRQVSDSFRHVIWGKQKEKVVQRTMNVAGIPDGFYC